MAVVDPTSHAAQTPPLGLNNTLNKTSPYAARLCGEVSRSSQQQQPARHKSPASHLVESISGLFFVRQAVRDPRCKRRLGEDFQHSGGVTQADSCLRGASHSRRQTAYPVVLSLDSNNGYRSRLGTPSQTPELCSRALSSSLPLNHLASGLRGC